jgi:carbamoyl-phosphate synthase small subunit
MKYQTKRPALILLADGTIFHGKAVGDKEGTSFGEVCFNTGMTGYQEIFTDPSYFGQLMVTTNAHIGNYGATDLETESDGVKISGLNAVISTDVDNIEGLKAKLAEVPSMNGLELASKVSTKEAYFFGEESAPIKIAALDIGIKRNILRNMAKRGAYIKVFPYNTSYKEMSAWNADGYFLSNGPGDPEPLENAIQVAKDIIAEDKPLFGICLGHQVIALANGISTYKMHNGHRGINHPVKNLLTGKGEITSQNHGFAIHREETEAHPDVEITHVHLNDHTVAGIRLKSKNCFSVQYHPEASPGPNDATYLFDQFIENIGKVTV